MEWLYQLTPTQWLVFGLVLLALEVAAGIAYLLGPGIAAIAVAAVHWAVPLSPAGQLVLFVIGSIVATFAYARYFKNGENDSAADGLHNRLHSMVGKETELTGPVNGNDRIAFGDTLWRVRSEQPIAAGQKVKVTAVDIDILVIEAV